MVLALLLIGPAEICAQGAKNTAVIPVGRIEQDSYDWYARHQAVLEHHKDLRPKVVLIGDSITHFWDGPPHDVEARGPMAWKYAFGDMPVLNMGFGYDRTQNVLWRLQHGELAGLHPQWIVLEIGTNNLAATANAQANTPEEVADAISAIYAELRRESTESHVIVMGIFPRGAKAGGRFRKPILETNRLIQGRLANDVAVTYLDIGSKFFEPDGSLPVALMPDGVHPSEAGYRVWADALVQAGVHP